ncbi:MAG: hypothetical protein UV59_C0001G0067 [Candidatus Gottesmanbacteria bacterium GW2011_GWA1_43_11]|uniref:Glycosyltransferase RgtA/B/C/D-like domain-containing protein n=1 Tax=Candidatus Gottesmanbacteria bacterium GW2011_GWA1_43_11 TaxID=1618436 RepID=A0A0G1CLG3_9BACT|nr:MAG: hypothetical protein UV59_C0001G0067 [Candidatus Gottesmanbacteria bacterium GW2011_GWA1_43_11]
MLIIWRIFLYGVAFLTQINFPFSPQFPYSDIYMFPSGLPQWVWAWANFDGVHYLTIAQHGYMAQFTQAFFPLFPLLMRFLGMILNDKFLIITGQIISFISLSLALVFFRKLLMFDYKPPVIFRSIAILLLFPTSFFFAAIYTESFFLLLVILTFYFARKRNWWLCALIGALAAATRITGILLLPALCVEYMNVKLFSKNLVNGLAQKMVGLIKTPLLYIMPMGFVIYALYLQRNFGDWLYFWHAQPAFGAERSAAFILPPQVIWRYIKILLTVSYTSNSFFTAAVEFIAYCGAVLLMIVGHKQRIRSSYLLFGWLVVLVPSLTGTLSSMPRYILLAFPLYLVLGIFLRRNLWFLTVSAIFLSMLILFTSYFIRGLWVA